MRSTDSELPGSSGRAGNPRGAWKRPGSLPRDGEAEAAEEGRRRKGWREEGGEKSLALIPSKQWYSSYSTFQTFLSKILEHSS